MTKLINDIRILLKLPIKKYKIMADDKLSSFNLFKAGLSVGGIVLGGILIKQDQKCLYSIGCDKNTFIGSGMIICGTAHILRTIGIIDDDFTLRMNSVGVSLTSVVPAIAMAAEYFKNKNREAYFAQRVNGNGVPDVNIPVWYHPIHVVQPGEGLNNNALQPGEGLNNNDVVQNVEQMEDPVDYPDIGQ